MSEPGAQSRPDGLIEIMLRSGVTRRLVGQVDEHALRRLLDAVIALSLPDAGMLPENGRSFT